MDSYPNYNPEDERSYPAAPKGAGSGPDGVPLGPDHNPPSGGYVPNDEQWAGVAAFPLSSPYTGMSSGEPPAPIFRPELDGPGVARGGFPSRTDVGARSKPTNRRRVLAGLAAFLLLVLVVGGLAFVLLGGGTGSGHPTANGGNGGAPVIVGTDTPTPTPTLLPGQTPLPTAIPATPTRVLAPGQATPTPIPYASSASISFTRATQGVASSGSVTVSTGAGDSRLAVVDAHDSADGNATATGSYNPGSRIVINISVTNTNTTQSVWSYFGTNVPSNTSGVACSIGGSDVLLSPGQQVNQPCGEPASPEPAVTYSTSNGSLQYSGSAPAGGSSPYYYVPSGCGNASASQSAAKTALQSKLNGEMNGTTVYLSLPDLSYSALSCTPGSGQAISGGSTYTQTTTATGSQSGYNPGGVSAYQQAQVGVSGAGWQLIGANGCSPSVQGGASLTSANIACQATGTEAWKAFDLGGMAQLIHGQTQGAAKGELNAVQGVVANSETFSLSGGSYLPTNASNISFHYSP